MRSQQATPWTTSPRSPRAPYLGPAKTMAMILDQPHKILCCQCAVVIEPNAVNMCVNCLQERYDIGAGVSKQVQQNTCRGCNRFERRDGSWAEVDMESKELLALLLKKPRGLTQVRLIDASYVWTEPHSRRIHAESTLSSAQEIFENQQEITTLTVICKSCAQVLNPSVCSLKNKY